MKSEQDRRRALSTTTTTAGAIIALAALILAGLAVYAAAAQPAVSNQPVVCAGVPPELMDNVNCVSPAPQSPSPAPQLPQAAQGVNLCDIPEANCSPPAVAIGAAALQSAAIVNACDIPEAPGCW